jgi:tetratricopeptide (TPR) repeat protein
VNRYILQTALLLTLLGVALPAEAQSTAVHRYKWPQYQQAGELALQNHHLAEAVTQFSLAKQELQSHGQFNADLGRTLNSLGVTYMQMGQFAKAQASFKRALQIRQQLLGPNHKDVAVTLMNLSDLARVQGLNPMADTYRQQALAIDPALGDTNVVNVSLNGSVTKSGKLDPNRFTDLEAQNDPGNFTLFGQAYSTKHADLAALLNDQGLSMFRRGFYIDAENLYKRSLFQELQRNGAQHPRVAEVLNNMGVLYETQGRYKESESVLRQAITIQQAALGKTDPAVYKTYNNLKLLFLAQGRYDALDQLAQEYFPLPAENGLDIPIRPKVQNPSPTVKKPIKKAPGKRSAKRKPGKK